MKNFTATLIAILFAVSLTCESFAQDTKDSVLKTARSADESKGEVDVALAELIKRGDIVVNVEGQKSGNAQDKNSGGVINGRAIELVQPAYPAMARSAHASGEVIVRVLINKEGKVIAAQIVDGDPMFRATSIRAAKASRFNPTLVDGKPVNVVAQIVYNFRVM